MSQVNETSTKKSTPKSAKKQDLPPVSRIVQIPVSLLKPGDKVLYPGNKVIPVETVVSYCNRDETHELIVVTFVGQPKECYMAFEVEAKIYVYA